MADIRVISKRTTPRQQATLVYVGRPSALGNPFKLKEAGGTYTRDESVDAYEPYLRKKINEKDPTICAELNRLYKLAKAGPVDLQCFCAPLRCHADVIRKVLLEKLPT